MALIHPQGSLSWTASVSVDTVGYIVYQSEDTNPPVYSSPNVNVGNVLTVQLPIAGLPAVEGTVVFGVASIDGAGNISDIVVVTPVLIDVTPPAPPTDVVYTASPN